jgi:hypothetical protein
VTTESGRTWWAERPAILGVVVALVLATTSLCVRSWSDGAARAEGRCEEGGAPTSHRRQSERVSVRTTSTQKPTSRHSLRHEAVLQCKLTCTFNITGSGWRQPRLWVRSWVTQGRHEAGDAARRRCTTTSAYLQAALCQCSCNHISAYLGMETCCAQKVPHTGLEIQE